MRRNLYIIISFIIIGILAFGYLFADGPVIYKINELNSSDKVYENFVKDILSSKKYSKIKSGITVEDLEKYGNLPKLKFATYEIKDKDDIVSIAKKLFINPETLISVNRYKHISQVKAGTTMFIPNMRGVLHTVGKKTNVSEIAKLYDVSEVVLLYANELSNETLFQDEDIFIPNGTISDSDIEDFLGRVFIIPLANDPEITSPYGMRKDPFSGKNEMHYGIDYRASVGTPVYASQYGVVSEVSESTDGYGKLVVITHKDNYKTYYGHLNSIDVKEKQLVQTGQKIAETGNTGRSTGPHLHFEIRYKNIPQDPMKLDNYGKNKPSFVDYFQTQKYEN